MTKYIRVDWPESQKFVDNPECYIAIPNDPTNYEPSGHTYMVPEDVYNKMVHKLEYPKKYENTNLGTIVCYENYAVVNGVEHYWYDETDIKKGDKVLIYNHDTHEWTTSIVKSCQVGFPLLLENTNLLIGINSELIGHFDPEIFFNSKNG